jgi:hypothetical protein
MRLGYLDPIMAAAVFTALWLGRRVLWRWLQRFLARVGW